MRRFVQKIFPAAQVVLGLALGFGLGGCDRVQRVFTRDRSKEQIQEGATRLLAKDFRGAVTAFEQAIDGTARTSEAHFRLGIVYYDHLQDPLGAIHHFRRYLEVDQDGQFAKQARMNIARAEATLATSLSGSTLVSRQEATRIRSENLQLKQQLAVAKSAAGVPRSERKSSGPAPKTDPEEIATGPGPKPAPNSPEQRAATAAVKEAERKALAATRTYKVQPGDTLAGISKKFYQTPNRANDLLDANLNSLEGDAMKLRAGMTLIVP